MIITFKPWIKLLATAGLLAASPLAARETGANVRDKVEWLEEQQDPTVLAFTFTGDIRVNPHWDKTNIMYVATAKLPEKTLAFFGYPANPKPGDFYPFYFNMSQWMLNLQDLKLLSAAPLYHFVTGDIVLGFENDNGDELRKQLADFGKALPTFPSPIQLVVMPGNHETTHKDRKTRPGTTLTSASPNNTVAWRDFVKDQGLDKLAKNGPTLSDPEIFPGARMTQDQSTLTYSFDSPDQTCHFVVLNTDTLTDVMTDRGESAQGLIPLKWVTADIQKAQARSITQHIFVFGHKGIQYPSDMPMSARGEADRLDPRVGEPLRQLLIANGKVAGYFCSHVHLWHADTLADSGGPDTRPVQIVAGNGGCEPEKFWEPDKETGLAWNPDEPRGPFFGFTLVKVHRSGKVSYNSHQRPIPGSPATWYSYKEGVPAAPPAPGTVTWYTYQDVAARPRPQSVTIH